MSFLLDTNVVSEWVKPQPDRNVIAWLADVDEDRVFLSVISFAEIRRGLELLPGGRRRARLSVWLAEELPARFAERILAIDQQVAETWGVLMVRAQQLGLTLGSLAGKLSASSRSSSLSICFFSVVLRLSCFGFS